MFVHIFDHDNGTIYHGANGKGNTTKGHNVGINALQIHNDKGAQNADGKADEDHEGGSEMKEKEHADQSNRNKFFQ